VTRSIEPERPRPSIEEEQDLPVSLEREVVSLQAGGEPLPPRVRQDMEGRFGLPFETVRIHIGPDAVRLSESMQAHAFAVGEHIAFNEGCFAPNTAHGRFLLAHELAHVAQQRGGADVAGVEQQPARVRRGFWGDLYDSAAETLGDVADWAVDQVRDFGWRLLETISPEFARTVRAIVDEGILSWLGRQVARAWEGYVATLRALVPFDGPRQLIDLFAGLVERAAAIASAMVSGNCEPLMQAIGELKSFVTETVGVAWDRLTEFLRPVGEFFTGLWADFGAPAAQWLQQFGGDVWEGIQQLGRDFWEWVRPVREAAERVWNWFKEVLFGPADSGDETAGSEGGVIGWISRKAGEAWDWVKERTRPVWQPVADVVAKVAELIPPAFIREMGEHAQQLATQLDGVAGGMDGGEGVPESRDTLASVLPSVEAILGTVRRILVGAGRWLAERVAGVGSVFTQLVGGLRASDLLSWLAGAFGWLEEAVAALVTWANERVSVLFDWLVRGFDALTPFLQLVLETVRKVISIYGDLLQLPLLILNSIWQRVPACIREPVENFIKTQVLARIPVFGQFFSDPELWPRVQQTALNILRRIFVDGDLPGAAWAFFQAVLRIFNVPPELVVQILAKAAGAIGSILTNPLGFLANLLRAMGAGFTGFFSRIGTHLLTGFTGWLFSTVREAGIQPPADFSLRSVLGFVLEVLGVTVDNIFARLARRLDPAIVARLRSMLEVATGVWGFVATLVTEGPAGLWRELTERLSSLWETVVQGVVGFITERVIGWASRWLLSLLDVSGIMPVINTLIAIYRAIESFMEYLRQMLEIVNRVLDGIAGIARGAIEVAAGFVESALSSSLPIVIGFLANQAGLGRLSHRLRETLAGLRERVDAAIDWLIDRALRLGRAVIDMVRRGAAAVRRGAARLRDWWRARREFRVGGQPHSVYVEGSGRSARVMVASDPTPYQTFLGRVKVTPDKEADKQSAITIAGELDAAVATAARDNPGGSASGGVGAAWSASAAAPAAGTPTTTNHADIIDGLLGRLADATARFMPVDITRSTPPVYGARVNGFGSSASVLRLTPIHPNGSSPSSGDMGNPLWGKVAKRKQGEGVYYIKGHLLNDNLGGPGGTWDNLTPLTQAANSDHKNQFEKFAKLAVNGSEGPYSEPTPAQAQARNLKTIQFVVTARYGQTARTSDIAYLRAQGNPDADDKADILEGEQAVPAALDCAAHELLPNGNAGPSVANHTVQNTIDSDLDHYSTRPTPLRIVYLNLMSRDELMSLNGIGPTLADDILRERPFRTRQEMQTKVHIADGRWNQMQSTPGIEVRIFQRG
jgi:phage-related protein